MLSIYELESRRTRAIALHAQGQSRKAIAAELSVHYVTVKRWLRIHREGGLEAIRAKRRGRPARPLLSDANPLTDGLGHDYDVDTDPRFATHRHPMDDIEPEAVSPHRAAADKMRAGMAWLVGKRWNPEAIARRSYAAALVISGGLFDDTRIEQLARKMNVTKQALSKNMSEFRNLVLDDVPLALPNLRSAQARARMQAAMRESHQKRKAAA